MTNLNKLMQEKPTIYAMTRDIKSNKNVMFKSFEKVTVVNRDEDTIMVVNDKGDRLITKQFNIMQIVDCCL